MVGVIGVSQHLPFHRASKGVARFDVKIILEFISWDIPANRAGAGQAFQVVVLEKQVLPAYRGGIVLDTGDVAVWIIIITQFQQTVPTCSVCSRPPCSSRS